MRRLIPLGLLAVLLAAGAPALSRATTMIHLDTRDLTLESSDIVIGTVESTRSYWNPDRTRIYTDVDVRVTRLLKGGEPERLTLTQLGGEVDGVRYTVHAMPVFQPGEEALLFVWRDAKGRAQVNGLAQGKFDIHRDPATGEATVQRPLPGFSARDAMTLAPVPEGEEAPNLRLDDMIREIQRVMMKEAGR